MAIPNHSSILIIGGGTWGCSIAYRLAKRGFENIKVLDANEYPSKESAGNDVNKIMEERKFSMPKSRTITSSFLVIIANPMSSRSTALRQR